MKLNTQSVGFKADAKLLDYIDKKMGKMDRFYDRIIEANIVLKLENVGQVRDKVAEVSLKVPGQVIFAKETNKSFEESVDKVADNLKRQLIKYKDLLRGN